MTPAVTEYYSSGKIPVFITLENTYKNLMLKFHLDSINVLSPTTFYQLTDKSSSYRLNSDRTVSTL
jgi:hypothetical protein